MLLVVSATPAHADRLIDLSYAYDADTIYWPTESGFVLEKEYDGVTPKGYYYASNRFSSPEHGGTHIDAPVHFAEHHPTVDAIPLERLMGPGVVIDVERACARDRDYQVRVDDVTAWEKQHGTIPAGAIVFIRTGFGRFWPDRTRYMGTAERGQDAVRQAALSRARGGRGARVGERTEGGRGWYRHAEHRPRPIDHVHHPRDALRARRAGARERRQSGSLASQRLQGDCAADEDSWWKRRTRTHHRRAPGLVAGPGFASS
jgi:kynurenine formamidase